MLPTGKPYDFILEKLSASAQPDGDLLWQGMHKLLDQHMPAQEEKKRRIAGWITFAGIATVVTVCLVYFGWMHSHSPSKSESTHNKQAPGSGSEHRVNTHRSVGNNASPILTTDSTLHSNQSTASPRNVVHVPRHARVTKRYAQKNSHGRNSGGQAGTATAPLISANSLAADSLVTVHNNQYLTDNPHKPHSTSIVWDKRQSVVFTPTDSATHTPLVFDVRKMHTEKGRKGLVAGAAFSYNLPVSGQEMSTVNMNGKRTTLFDYLPSLFVQYHFSNKWFVQSQFQFIAPQYTKALTLNHSFTTLAWNKKNEQTISLNKLYYMNLPLTIHYYVGPHFSVGVGLQYSYLKRSVLEDYKCLWVQETGGWTKTQESEQMTVRTNPGQLKKAQVAGRGRSGGGTSTSSPVDSVAESFRSNDIRWVAEANYHLNRFNLGVQVNVGMDNYINTQAGNSSAQLRDRNEAVQLYLRYNFLDTRKRPKQLTRHN